MTLYLRDGISYRPADEAELDLQSQLPPGNYIVKEHPISKEYYFESVGAFPKIGKLYGDLDLRASRILTTFEERRASTGVLLTGEKGSGKTLLARVLSIKAFALGYPTIIVTTALGGEKFSQLIQAVTQPALVLFDEFEKVYRYDKQQELLTLLDGVFPSKKLFVLTCNDEYSVDSNLKNRPGRAYYKIRFKGLSGDAITEYCQDRLKDKTHIPTICKISMLFSAFNFDMLQSLVEEMNRYGETPHQALEMLNVNPSGESSGEAGQYDVEITTPQGEILPREQFDPDVLSKSPLAIERLEFRLTDKEYDDPGSSIYFEPGDLERIDVQKGRFAYRSGKGYTAVITRRKAKEFSYSDWKF